MFAIWSMVVVILAMSRLEAFKILQPAMYIESRIVGGDTAQDQAYPHQISFQVGNTLAHHCGGSIIEEKFILSAAHCFRVMDLNYYTIIAGTNKLQERKVVRKIQEIHIHESYGDFKNDIALVKISEPFVFDNSVQPIKVLEGEVPPNSNITITGWGRLSTSGAIPNYLQYNDKMNSLSFEDCEKAIGRYNDNGIICLAKKSNNGACFGDSGGPATYKGFLIGIANFVMEACGTSSPDGYCKVSKYRDWINNKAGREIV